MREYRLGGASAVPWLSKRKLAALISTGVISVFLMAALIVVQDPWFALVTICFVGAFVWMFTSRGRDGGLNVFSVGEVLRMAIARRAHWDDFDPELESQPWLLEPMGIVAVPAAQDTELAVLRYPRSGAMVCVLEVSSAPHGMKPPDALGRADTEVIRLHKALADPRLCVEQIDWLTMVRPESAAMIGAGFSPVAGLSTQQQESVNQLAPLIASYSEQFRSYAMVRFNTEALFAKVAQPPYTRHSGVEAAFEALGQVARLMNEQGIKVLSGLGPAEVAAVIRATVMPDYDPDDLNGCDDFWRACEGWQTDKDHIRSKGWTHLTGTFGLQDWPVDPVPGRWLEPLVFGAELGPRAIMTQIQIMPRHQARRFAKDQLTTARSKRRRKEKTGEIDGGEAEVVESAAQIVAEDVIKRKHIGIKPTVRVLISARSPRALRQAKERLSFAALNTMNAESISYDTSRLGAGFLHMLPIGLKVER